MNAQIRLNRVVCGSLLVLMAGLASGKAQAASSSEDLRYAQRLLVQVMSSNGISKDNREKVATAFEKISMVNDQMLQEHSASLVSSTFNTNGGSGGSYRLCNDALQAIMSASNDGLIISGHCENDVADPNNFARAHLRVIVK